MKIRLIDSHTHLDMPQFENDLKGVINQANSAGVVGMVSVGVSLSSSRKALEIAYSHPNIFSTVGWHPHGAHDLTLDEISALKELAKDPKVVAWGEVGLDFFRNRAPRDKQIACFRRQISLAREVGLPLVIHDRDAHNDVVRVLREESAADVGGMFHCFSGNWALARKVLDLGFYISIPGTVTFKNATVQQDVVKKCPEDRLLIETDAPFLAPVPYRGKRNEPSYLVYTARKISELRGISLERLAERTFANALSLFNINVDSD